MAKNLLALGVLFLMNVVPVHSQNYIKVLDSLQSSKSFSEIVKQIESYYANKEKGKGSGYKQFKRWEYYQSSRINFNNKYFSATQKNWDEFYKYSLTPSMKALERSNKFRGNWRSMGFKSYQRFGSGYNGGVGRVNCIVVDPSNTNIIYVGTPGGGLWRSVNRGLSWKPLTDGIPHVGVSGIAIDPKSPKNNRKIYILTGDGDGGNTNSIGVFVSKNNGNTWYSTGLKWKINDYKRGSKLVIHPSNNNMLFVATSSGIYRTTNSGQSWKVVQNGNFKDIEFNTANANILYASTSNGKIYKSTNTGANWTQLTNGLPNSSNRVAIAVTKANSNFLYALYGGVSQGKFTGVYLSTNGGNSFTLMSNSPNILGYSNTGNDSSDQSWYDLAIAASPTNANEIQIGGINCWRSRNRGKTWENTSYWLESKAKKGDYTHADIHTLDYINGNTLYCGSDGGIYVSDNKADDWRSISTGLEITQFYRIGGNAKRADIILGGAQDNGSNRMQNSKIYHWYGADGFECIADPNDVNTIYGSVQLGGIVRSKNNGSSIKRITPKNQKGAWLTPYVMDPNNSKTLYAGYTDVYKTTDSGDNWTNISNSKIGNGYCTHINVARSDNKTIYASKYNKIYKTTDGGNNWTNVSSGLPNNKITYFVIHPENKNKVWAVVSGYSQGNKVYKTTNGGNSWTNISKGLPNLPVNCIEYQIGSNDRLYVGLDVGIYYIDNSLTSWKPFNRGLPNVEIFELEINYVTNKLRAGTFGRGVWESDIHLGTAPECVERLVFSTVQSGNKNYKAKTIESKSVIARNSNINYKASNEIILKPGFSTISATNFNAKIDKNICNTPSNYNRSSNLLTEVEEVTGTYAGPMPGVIATIDTDNIIEDNNTKEDIKLLSLYPNPASDICNVQFYSNGYKEVVIELVDSYGKTLKSLIFNNVTTGNHTVNFELSNYAKGLYIVKYSSGKISKSAKLLVK